MAGFLTPLRLEFIDGKNWRVTEPFEYRLGSDDGSESIQIPIGFETDFASIPRGLWNIFPPTGGYGKAAVVHDWLYRRRIITTGDGSTRLCNRGEADKILLEAMGVLGCSRFTRWTIYSAVRVGGHGAWQDSRRTENNDGGHH